MEDGKLTNGWESPLMQSPAQIWTPTTFVQSSKVKTFIVFDVQIFANCMHSDSNLDGALCPNLDISQDCKVNDFVNNNNKKKTLTLLKDPLPPAKKSCPGHVKII